MTGTLVNAAAIAAGGCVGLLLKKGVKGSHQDSINKALGVAVLVPVSYTHLTLPTT